MALVGPMFMVPGCGGGDDNGGGGSGGGGGSNNKKPPPASSANQFAYAISSGANQVQAFTSDANGNLTSIGPPLTTAAEPHHVNVDPQGKFVYVGNHGAGLSGYRINQDGSLTAMNGTPGSLITGSDPAELQPHSSVLDRNRQNLYVVAGTGPSTVRAYTVDSNTGALTFMPGQSFPGGVHGHNIAISPNNQFVLVAYEGTSELRVFIRNADGTLTPIAGTGTGTTAVGTVTGLNGAAAITVDQQNKFVYVTMLNSVEVFSLANNGVTRIPGNSSFQTGNGPHSIAISADNQTLYVANLNTSDINVFRVDQTTGGLGAAPIQTVPTQPAGGTPNYVVIHPNAKTLYTANQTNNGLSQFTINADGTLVTPGTAITVAPGTNGIATTKL